MENQNGFLTPNCTQSSRRVRPSPLPQLNMSDPGEMWESMILTDEIYSRDAHMLARHQNITPRMRSILLDWLSEVSELFKLHRETFYFALDFVDRYLSNTRDIPRHQLQLIGTTCLFIASKIEEVYPPKIADIAYVTDGACSADEIISKELVIMETLKWSLHPITVNKWLSIFMQIYSILEKENNRDPEARSTGEKFLIPNYSATFFAQIAHLIDLCMLDIGSLQFNYDLIAASAFYHFTNEQTVYSCTRFRYSDLKDCVIWMTPFALAVRETGLIEPKVPAQSNNGSWSNMQYHTADLTLLEKAHMRQIDLTEDDSSESSSSSSSSSMPPSPVSSSPYNAQLKMLKKRKRESSPIITITTSPLKISNSSSSTSTSSSPSSPSTSPTSSAFSSLSKPLSTSPTSPATVASSVASSSTVSTKLPSASALTPSSLCNKQETKIKATTKRKRDLNNNNNANNNSDTDIDEDEGNNNHSHDVLNEKKMNVTICSRRSSKRKRSFSPTKIVPSTRRT